MWCQFGKDWKSAFLKAFYDMKQASLLVDNSGFIRLTPRAMLLDDVVFCAIL
jgi:hypothetical protein